MKENFIDLKIIKSPIIAPNPPNIAARKINCGFDARKNPMLNAVEKPNERKMPEIKNPG